MITPKQRAELKALANPLEPVFQIGKGGVNEAQILQIDDYMRVHELIKIKVLDNSMYTAKEAAAEIAEKNRRRGRSGNRLEGCSLQAQRKGACYHAEK